MVSRKAVMMYQSGGRKWTGDFPAEAKCGSGARGGKTLKMWGKSLKNNWVEAKVDVA